MLGLGIVVSYLEKAKKTIIAMLMLTLMYYKSRSGSRKYKMIVMVNLNMVGLEAK